MQKIHFALYPTWLTIRVEKIDKNLEWSFRVLCKKNLVNNINKLNTKIFQCSTNQFKGTCKDLYAVNRGNKMMAISPGAGGNGHFFSIALV